MEAEYVLILTDIKINEKEEYIVNFEILLNYYNDYFHILNKEHNFIIHLHF